MSLLFFPFLEYDHGALQQRLAGKTVLITGASYGIGESLAERLAGTGAYLLLVARTEDKLLEVKQKVEARGGRANILPCDLRNEAEVEALLGKIYSYTDGVDIFVNNAGKSIRRSIFASLDRMHDFKRTMNLNYFGPVQLVLALIPMLVARRGQIINVSTISVRLAPMPKWAGYQASKAAFDQWLRCVAPELSAQGVSTSALYLPLVKTRMIEPTQAYRHAPAMQPDDVARLICKAMLSRKSIYAPWWLFPGEIASVVLRRPWELLVSRLTFPRS